MADITVTAAKVGLLFPQQSEVYSVILAETVTAGQALYQTSSGTFGLADVDASGKDEFRGIALEGGGAGQAISMLKRGFVGGFTLSSNTKDAAVYLSTTAGGLTSGAASTVVEAGRVMVLADKSVTAVLYVNARWEEDYS